MLEVIWFKYYIQLFTIFLPLISLGQLDPIDVADLTIKVGAFSTEELFYGFEEGDEVIISIQEKRGKKLRTVEFYRYEGQSSFSDFKTSLVEGKKVGIKSRDVYVLRIHNGGLGGRICKVKIQRIPSSPELASFNTDVEWKVIPDTTVKIKKEKYLVSSDTSIHILTSQVAKVHSVMNLNGNKTSLFFVLPANTVAWSYYIGVDQSGADELKKATSQLAKYASGPLSKLPGYGPTAAVALNAASYLTLLQKGEDVDYYIVDNSNKILYDNGSAFKYYKKGKVINDFSRMTLPNSGAYHICLSNDNAVMGINVTVEIVAIVVKNEWDKRNVETYNIKNIEKPVLKWSN